MGPEGAAGPVVPAAPAFLGDYTNGALRFQGYNPLRTGPQSS